MSEANDAKTQPGVIRQSNGQNILATKPDTPGILTRLVFAALTVISIVPLSIVMAYIGYGAYSYGLSGLLTFIPGTVAVSFVFLPVAACAFVVVFVISLLLQRFAREWGVARNVYLARPVWWATAIFLSVYLVVLSRIITHYGAYIIETDVSGMQLLFFALLTIGMPLVGAVMQITMKWIWSGRQAYIVRSVIVGALCLTPTALFPIANLDPTYAVIGDDGRLPIIEGIEMPTYTPKGLEEEAYCRNSLTRITASCSYSFASYPAYLTQESQDIIGKEPALRQSDPDWSPTYASYAPSGFLTLQASRYDKSFEPYLYNSTTQTCDVDMLILEVRGKTSRKRGITNIAHPEKCITVKTDGGVVLYGPAGSEQGLGDMTRSKYFIKNGCIYFLVTAQPAIVDSYPAKRQFYIDPNFKTEILKMVDSLQPVTTL